jgi:hypothetical protein
MPGSCFYVPVTKETDMTTIGLIRNAAGRYQFMPAFGTSTAMATITRLGRWWQVDIMDLHTLEPFETVGKYRTLAEGIEQAECFVNRVYAIRA